MVCSTTALFHLPRVCPRGQKTEMSSHRKLSLVFFNTFDPIQLSPKSIMHEKDIPMLCEDAPSQIPTMYICPVTNVLGRIPLIPCYMDGQKHLTGNQNWEELFQIQNQTMEQEADCMS